MILTPTGLALESQCQHSGATAERQRQPLENGEERRRRQLREHQGSEICVYAGGADQGRAAYFCFLCQGCVCVGVFAVYVVVRERVGTKGLKACDIPNVCWWVS